MGDMAGKKGDNSDLLDEMERRSLISEIFSYR